MATVRLWTDAEAEADPVVARVFADIRTTRKSDYVNNFWRGLANHPALLESTLSRVKAVMATPGAPDPVVREMITSRSRRATPAATVECAPDVEQVRRRILSGSGG